MGGEIGGFEGDADGTTGDGMMGIDGRLPLRFWSQQKKPHPQPVKRPAGSGPAGGATGGTTGGRIGGAAGIVLDSMREDAGAVDVTSFAGADLVLTWTGTGAGVAPASAKKNGMRHASTAGERIVLLLLILVPLVLMLYSGRDVDGGRLAGPDVVR